MIYFLLAHMFAFLLDLIAIAWRSDHEKDLEILLLRQQLHILQRKRPGPPRISRWEKLALAVLAAKLTAVGSSARSRMGQIVLVFKPETLLKWHRELVRCKWTFTNRRMGGRPPITAELEALILRLAKENPRWGYGKLHGELLKLGYDLSRTTVKDVLKRHRVPPAPERAKRASSWRSFLHHYQDQILACAFFTVETVWLKTIYVLFFIEIGTRRVHLAGCTSQPTAGWVAQQARQLSWTIQGERLPLRFLIHDRDAKFPAAFDTVFAAEGIEVIRTPYRAPRANAVAERWIRSVREECLDHLLVVSEAHLRRMLSEYVRYFNYARPTKASVSRSQSVTNGCRGWSRAVQG
ncbi:MAG TPA: helix-turn-helix domain-containing protein [Herpetosiphonaceae bacterium]|nr:helix-turn-helix domain-containing protein [Herpetosiphonaceae bacterium]